MATGVPSARPLHPGMRVLLMIAGGLVLIAGTGLFVFTPGVNATFAWEVGPLISAAFLGANYLSACPLEWAASRQKHWADARVGVPAVLFFTALVLLLSVVNIPYFRMERPAAWAWMAVYAVVPIAMGWLLLEQRKLPGGDPSKDVPMPSWMRGLLVAQAVPLLGLGVAFLVAGGACADLWPWDLRGSTGQVAGQDLTAYVAAWLLGYGIVTAQSAWEKDLRRARVGSWGLAFLGPLNFIVLARYPDGVDWSAIRTWVYVAFLASFTLVGIAGLAMSRTARPAAHAA